MSRSKKESSVVIRLIKMCYFYDITHIFNKIAKNQANII